MTCIKDDPYYDDEDINDKYKAHVVPVGIFSSNVTDTDAFNQTLAQAGLKMPDNFNKTRMIIKNDTIYVNQISY